MTTDFVREAAPIDLATYHRLMKGCEQFLMILEQHHLTAWPDFGTLLGYARHRNVIPWDYDADYCLLAPDYARLQQVFAEAGGVIGSLRLEPDYYGDPAGCCCLLFTDWPDDDLGIDVVAYAIQGDTVRSLMSQEVLEDYPDNYDCVVNVVFPLRRDFFLGQRVLVPQRIEERLGEIFGAGWRCYPAGYTDSAVTAPPFQELPRAQAAPADWRTPLLVPDIGAASGHVWRNSTPAIVRVLTAEARAGLSLAEESFQSLTFTDLVFQQERRLWGQVFVGRVEPGEALLLPAGSWINARLEED